MALVRLKEKVNIPHNSGKRIERGTRGIQGGLMRKSDKAMTLFKLFIIFSFSCSLLMIFVGTYLTPEIHNDIALPQNPQKRVRTRLVKDKRWFAEAEYDLAKLIGGWIPNHEQSYDRVEYLILSHCNASIQSLEFVASYLHETKIVNVRIYNRCDTKVSFSLREAADVFHGSDVELRKASNFGRYEYTLLTWISTHKFSDDDDDVVLFLNLNDFRPDKNDATLWWGANDMMKIVSQKGFVCLNTRMRISNRKKKMIKYTDVFSPYHSTSIWKKYKFPRKGPNNEFHSPYNTLGNWTNQRLGFSFSNQEFVEVCYGGTFATTTKELQRIGVDRWNMIKSDLERGRDIEESHYLERLWGALLAKPLHRSTLDVISENMGEVHCEERWLDFCGVITISKTKYKPTYIPEEYSQLKSLYSPKNALKADPNVKKSGVSEEKLQSLKDQYLRNLPKLSISKPANVRVPLKRPKPIYKPANEFFYQNNYINSKVNFASNARTGLNFTESEIDQLWFGSPIPTDSKSNNFENFHIVMWYCDKSIQWLNHYIKDTPIASMTIYSVCNNQVKGLSNETYANVTIVQKKISREEAFLTWITTNYKNFDSKDLIFFTHDNPFSSYNWFWWSLNKVQSSASVKGFGCAQSPIRKDGTAFSNYYSSLHVLQSKRSYFTKSNGSLYATQSTTMRDWFGSMGFTLQNNQYLLPVCYGDSFIVSMKAIYDKHDFLQKAENSLNMKNASIEESNEYLSLSWAMIFSDKVSEAEKQVINNLALLVPNKNFDGEKRYGLLQKESKQQHQDIASNLVSIHGKSGIIERPFIESDSSDALWSGNVIQGEEALLGNITIVVSHCDQSLNWLNGFLSNKTIHKIFIYSTCGETVHGAPQSAEIISTNENVGHNLVYSRWIQNMEELKSNNTNDVVFFLNDLSPFRSMDWLWWSLDDMLRIVSSNGFACAETCFPAPRNNKLRGAFLGPYHSNHQFWNYKPTMYKGFVPWFNSTFANIGDWFDSLGLSYLGDRRILPVCYGSSFVATKGQLYKMIDPIKQMKIYLEREKDTEENYFAERTWAAILSKPLSAQGNVEIRKRTKMYRCDPDFEMRCGASTFNILDETKDFGIYPPDHLKPMNFEDEFISYPYIDEGNITALWTGNVVHGAESELGKFHIVVSHCDKDLHWLKEYVAGKEVESTTIFSKCGNEVVGAPSDAIIKILPNVGRCDHTYAYWMNRMQEVTPENKFDTILFIKDNDHRSDTWALWSLADMFRIVSVNGFVCGESVLPPPGEIGYENVSMSVYHDYEKWRIFNNKGYSRELDRDSTRRFKSAYSNLGEWIDHMDYIIQRPFVPVCYGGIFMTTRNQIAKQKPKVWEKLEDALSRGDNIEEGHFAERTWAALLSKPINPEKNFYLAERNGLKRCVGYFLGRCGVLTIKPWNVDAMLAKQGS